MAKRRVDGRGNRQLDSSVGTITPGQTPNMALFKREVVGRSADGNRLFDWVPFDEAKVVTYESRNVEGDDGVIRVRVKVVALYPGEFLEMDGVAFKIDSDAGDEPFYRIMDFQQNGLKLVMEAEAAL